jgi:hypothetical protein
LLDDLFEQPAGTFPCCPKHANHRKMAKAARFETPDGTENIGRDLLLSVRTQSLTEDLEAEETPIKPDGTR